MRKLLFLPLAFLLLCGQLLAQNRTITGKVTDENGNPLTNVSVLVKGTTLGTVTREDGTYSISVPSNARLLVISSVNMEPKEVSIGNQTSVNTSLTSANSSLSEVVVVGYGTTSRKNLTSSVSKIGAKEIENLPIQGPDQALRGRAAGVTVTQSSGTPGSSINVVIRGAGSISASNQPLYVVDGIPLNIGSYSQLGAGGQVLNSLSDINPNEIESFEVLKDAAATAVYGSRAANGVVIITTKRGKNAKTAVNFNTYYGTSSAYKTLEPLSGPEHVALVQEEVRNRFGSTIKPSQIGLQGLDGAPESYSTNIWQDEIFRNAAIKSYDVNLRGGNDKTKFFIASSLFDQEGIILGSGFKRYNVRLNLDNNVTDKLKVGTSIGFSRSVSNRIQNDNNIYGVLSTALLLGSHIPVYNPDGTFGRDPNASIENPVANATLPTNDVKNNRLLANAQVEYQIIPSLSFKTVVGIDYVTFREQNFIPSTHIQGAGVKGDGREGYSEEINLTNENILTYKKSFGVHDITVTGVASFQESKFESIFARAQNFPGNEILRLSAGSIRTSATSDGSSYGIIGYLGRINYGLMDKYLFSASVRRDGVSRFGRDKRYGTFPAFSAAWRVSQEKFLENLRFISDLKLRASYGIAGNSSFSDFGSLPLVAGGANYLQSAGLAPTQLGNPDLGWEEAEQKNVGIDLGLLRSRINVTADYFIKTTKNLLLGRPLVGSSGFTTINQNIGSVENKGFEFGLNTVNITNSNLTWSTNFNITFPENKIKKLAGTPFASGFASWVEEGQALGSFRGYRVVGIFQTQAEIAAAPTQSSSTRPGDIQFADLNKDGAITSADQEILGNANPDFYGGLTNSVSFKGFELSAFLQFVSGNSIYNNTRAFYEGMNSIFGSSKTTLNRWTPTNPSTEYPRAVFGDPNNNRRTSTRFLEDGSFMRLKNIVLSYGLPSNITSKLKIQKARIYVQGENLKTWTGYKGFDPEVSTFSITNTAPGTDFLTFPQARTFTAGLNITF